MSFLWDRAFLINLARRSDRLNDSMDELRRCGITGVERYDAFDHPTSGHEGCSRSHRDLMRALADAPWDRTLILEDDIAAVTKSQLKLAGFIESQEVWKTHCSILNGDGNVMERLSALQPFLPTEFDVLYIGGGYQEAPQHRVNKHLIRTNGMLTTSSLVVTREFAKKFTAKADLDTGGDREKWIGPIDLFYSSMARDNAFYCIQPRLLFQRRSPSDITGRADSYLYSMTDPAIEESLA